MCELLGMSANVPTDVVFSFTGLMQRGVILAHTVMVGVLVFTKAVVCVYFKTHKPVPIQKLHA